MELASPSLDQVIQAEIGARREIQRQNAIVPPRDEHRGDAVQIAGSKDLTDALCDPSRVLQRRAGERPI